MRVPANQPLGVAFCINKATPNDSPACKKLPVSVRSAVVCYRWGVNRGFTDFL